LAVAIYSKVGQAVGLLRVKAASSGAVAVVVQMALALLAASLAGAEAVRALARLGQVSARAVVVAGDRRLPRKLPDSLVVVVMYSL
jgi:hypothetical protein